MIKYNFEKPRHLVQKGTQKKKDFEMYLSFVKLTSVLSHNGNIANNTNILIVLFR